MINALCWQKCPQNEEALTQKGEMMQLWKYTLPVIVSVMLGCVAVVPVVEAQSRRPSQALLKLIRAEPAGQDVLLTFRVPEALDLGCPMQLRIGDISVNFREVQDQKARTARFVVARDLYTAIDNRQFNTVLTSCFNWVSNSITYPRLKGANPPPASQAVLKLIRVEPAGQDVLLAFRVPEALDLGCPMQLRIGDFSVNFREVQDQKARTARFVMSRDVYTAIDNRQFNTVLTSCSGRVENSITYPRLKGATPPSAPQAILKLIRVEPAGQDVLLAFRVPEALDLGCPMQLRIGDFSVNFREVQDQKARTARFVMSRDVYTAIDNRQFTTVLTSCSGRVENSITYPPLSRARQVGR